MNKTKITYDRTYFSNRWNQRKYARNSDWVIFGFSTRWASPYDFCYRFSFFGLELSVWFNREFL